ncbi:hypothetical protein [Corallococcus carmarthensis]|uniref:Uncharacterized protein n=1 Tax=Corallococcus carmarthensis TaxID=2316728 RepID=A0A3A8K1R3_9BACT|nr:hypothetical protein [Corallococcus carmarthensis]RKH02103.1 hypothetical protein D7X32_17990 [Corallococcus carmarthensis]
MSICILMKQRPESATSEELIPLASEEVFRRYWVPGCVALGLRWVPLFRTGVPLQKEDLGPVLTELRALRQWMEEQPDEGTVAVRSRLDEALMILERAAALPETDIFIG